MLILFQPACFSSRWSHQSPHPQDQFQAFSQRCLFHPSQGDFVFPAFPPFLFKDSDFLIEYPFYWCEVPSFFSINVLTRWFSWRCSSSFSFFIFFSRGLNSSLQCWSHSFPCFKCFLMPVYLLIIHLLLFMLFGVLKISQETRISIPNPFKLSRGCYLFWAI